MVSRDCCAKGWEPVPYTTGMFPPWLGQLGLTLGWGQGAEEGTVTWLGNHLPLCVPGLRTSTLHLHISPLESHTAPPLTLIQVPRGSKPWEHQQMSPMHWRMGGYRGPQHPGGNHGDLRQSRVSGGAQRGQPITFASEKPLAQVVAFSVVGSQSCWLRAVYSPHYGMVQAVAHPGCS